MINMDAGGSIAEYYSKKMNLMSIFFFCRCLPMNLVKEDLLGIHKDRMKIGASLADVDPMQIDRTVSCMDCETSLLNGVWVCVEIIVINITPLTCIKLV